VADTLTQNLKLIKPDPGSNGWDGKLNGDLDLLDSIITGYIKISDVKTSGTSGGTFNAGAWQTRDLNTTDSDVNNLSALAGNQITLEPGTYVAYITCPAWTVNGNQSRLRDVTNSVTVLLGTNEQGVNSTSRSVISGLFTISSQTVFEVQHRCQSSKAFNGFGFALSWANEVYTSAEFRKIG